MLPSFLSNQFVSSRLHFRPKTPPPIKEEPSAPDPLFNPASTAPITIELQNLTSDLPTSLLDDTLFTTSPFTLQDLYADTMAPATPVPFDDTRQTFGCSRFSVSCDGDSDSACGSVVDSCSPNKIQSILSSTLTSPKFNSVNVVGDTWTQKVNHVSNGPLSHSEGKLAFFLYMW